jgi:asparagine synthase (glutamine-hydrolysing)
MPGLVGLTCSGSRPMDHRACVARMQALITDPARHVAEAVWADERVCGARSHNGRGHGPAQPVLAGGLVAWLDGEIHDLRALAPHLPESELSPVHALIETLGDDAGDDSLRTVDGIYSAAVYDPAAGTVRLISDRFGLRFLYWTLVDGRLVWASNLGALPAYPGLGVDVDVRTVQEILTVEHPIGDHTLLKGVRLLAPGTVLTFDLGSGRVTEDRYWWWDRIRPVGRISLNDAADELGRRIRRAVELRARPDEPVGVSLSGGLDSRALLAAMPPRPRPVETVTYGSEGCIDIAIAARVAALNGARHHVMPITSENWLAPRFAGVWWTDGQLDITDLHGTEDAELLVETCPISLDGFGGDLVLGGMYMGDASTYDRFDRALVARRMHCPVEFLGDLSAWEHLGRSDYYLMENRARRMNNAASAFSDAFTDARKPFLDNEVIEFVYGLPDALRARGLLYRRTLVRTFAEYYRHIPWASLGVPISWPRGVRRVGKWATHVGVKRHGTVRALGHRGRFTRGFTDYPAWLREEPVRSFVDGLLRDPEAFYLAYTSRDAALRIWEQHLAGADLDWEVGVRVSLEVWLQQARNGRFRQTAAGTGGAGVSDGREPSRGEPA